MNKRLIQNIKEGEDGAFAKLYNLYADYALRVAFAVIGEKASAADAVQETFIRIYKNIDNFDVDKPFEPWLYKILINECNRILVKNSKVILVEDFSDNKLTGIIEDDYRFQQYESLYNAIEALEDNLKIPIVLKYLKGMKESEIAQVLDINPNTAKSRLFTARQKLKNVIQKLEGGSEDYESYGR